MYLEIATIEIKPGHDRAFENAASQAIDIFRNATGCEGMELRRCVEHPLRYLLFVNWRTLEDHTTGFKNNPAGLQAWRKLVSEHYDGTPTLVHSVNVVPGFHAR